MAAQSSAAAKKRGNIESSAPQAEFSWDQSRTPNFTEEQIKTFLGESLGRLSGYYAAYMFTGDNNSSHKLPIGRGCHGYMHSTPIKGGWISALRYKDQKELNPETVDEASRWYIEKFLLGKFSPWAVLLPYLTIVYNKAKVPVAYIVDGDENKKAIDKHLLMNFNIASRWPREFPGSTQGMFDLWLSGHFKKTEALILQNLIRFNPATGAFTTVPNGRVGGGHHYYQNTNIYRLLERKPNTGMIFDKGRFQSVTGAISSNNDAPLWGYNDGRNHTKLQKMFDELSSGKIGKKTITRFGGVLMNIPEEAVLDFVKRFRELYEGECKRVPGGPYKDGREPERAVGTDSWEDYIGVYTQPRDVVSKF